MNVSLPPELEQYVQQRVESGVYPTAGELVRDALWLLRERDRLHEIRLDELRKEIQLGIAEADRGETAPLDIEHIKAKARQMRAERSKVV
jgi:antitoxin ParD1/3/4